MTTCNPQRITISILIAESDIQNNFKNRTKYKIKSTTSTRSQVFKICPHRTLEMAFQSTKFQNFLGNMPPDPPSAWPLQRSPDSSVIKKTPTILVGQSFCVNMIPSVFNSSKPVRNIPKFKDRANWSRNTFQPMRRRACVYQQTNQNIAPVIKNFQNNGRSRALRHIFKTFHGAYTIFLSGQRIGSHIGSVS